MYNAEFVLFIIVGIDFCCCFAVVNQHVAVQSFSYFSDYM